MRVFYGFDDLPHFDNPFVTVGSYDGVHRGHRQLLERITRLAKEQNGESVVITFSPHPRQVLEGDESLKLLNSLSEKVLLLEQVGVDNLIVVEFTKEFSKISSYDFVLQYLVGKVGVATLVVGYNHHFGHNKEGNFDFLNSLQSQFEFDIYMVPRHEVESDKVSSTVIRNLIERGEVYQAERYLGYSYFILASYNGGVKIDNPAKLLPPCGHYDVEIRVGERIWQEILWIDKCGNLQLANESNLPLRESFAILFKEN